MHRPTSHLAHLYIVLFLWPLKEHRQQWSWGDDFSGQCLLWLLSSHKTFFAPELGLPTNLGVGRSWLFPASSVKFLTRRSLKSRWVHLAPHEDNSIQLLSTVRSRRWKKQFHGPLEVTLILQRAVSHTIRIVYVTHVPVVPFHDVRFRGAVVTKISFCWWWVHVSQHVNFSSVLPN